MSQSLIQLKVDSALKNEVEEIYQSIGLDLSTAVKMFLIRSKLVRGLPFETSLPENFVTRQQALDAFEGLRKQAENLPEMSLEDVNAEISATRAERKAR